MLRRWKSRKSGDLSRDMQQCLFVSKTRSQRNSGILVLYQMQDFSIRIAAKKSIYQVKCKQSLILA